MSQLPVLCSTLTTSTEVNYSISVKNTDLHTIMDRRGNYSMFLTYLKQFLDLNGTFVCFFNDNSEQKIISALAQKLPDLL